MARFLSQPSCVFYGTTAFGGVGLCMINEYPTGCGTVYSLTPPVAPSTTWTESVSAFGNVIEPLAALNAGFYGVAAGGGMANEGAVFRAVPPSTPGGSWTETLVYSFLGGTDGASPYTRLLEISGNLFGTTFSGGDCGGQRNGTIFELKHPLRTGEPWVESKQYCFTGGSDGADPQGDLIRDAAGNLYGTTLGGGNGTSEGTQGEVFELTPPVSNTAPWVLTVLWRFSGGAGEGPAGGLIADGAGNFFGTTNGGGSTTCTWIDGSPKGCGTVWELSPSGPGWTLKVLHSFTGGSDGAGPNGDLLRDAAGNLYGTTALGGGSPNCKTTMGAAGIGCGTVFRVTPSGSETVLYAFQGGADGSRPSAGLIDVGGYFYGTTYTGGGAGCGLGINVGFPGCGTVFKLKP